MHLQSNISLKKSTLFIVFVAGFELYFCFKFRNNCHRIMTLIGQEKRKKFTITAREIFSLFYWCFSQHFLNSFEALLLLSF